VSEKFSDQNPLLTSSKPDYVPPARPYEMMHLTLDLIRFARYMLVPGGRLVFFLPTVTEEYDAIDIPVVEGMTELKWEDGSVQEFGKWGRRVRLTSRKRGCLRLTLQLVTMEKTAEDDGPVPTFDDYSVLEGTTAGHKDFNKRVRVN
jgi:tRNA (guanine10-N2)-methyltransferase